MNDPSDFFSSLEKIEEEQKIPPSLPFFQDTCKRFRKKPGALWGTGCLIFLSLLAWLIPCFSSFHYDALDLSLINSPPTWPFLFGTDDLGRDMLTRVFQGMRVSLLIGASAVFIDLLLGITIGSIAALAGGKVDELLMRFCDILYAIPYLLSVIILMILFEPGLLTILIALALSGWVNMARVVRGQIMEIKEKEYILATKALGLSKSVIFFRHLLPNALGPIIGALTLSLPSAIFAEAFLSFLGLGLQPPLASLGVLVSDGLGAFRFYPWRLFFPAGVLTLTMLSFNLIGDALRDALDPRLRS